jgi:hypothetical protein
MKLEFVASPDTACIGKRQYNYHTITDTKSPGHIALHYQQNDIIILNCTEIIELSINKNWAYV